MAGQEPRIDGGSPESHLAAMSAALKLDPSPSGPARLPSLSWKDYLVREAGSEVRHEFVNGQLYAMAGASRNHNRITLNVASELRQALEGRPCEPFMSDMKLHIRVGADEIGYYPDVVVCCDPSDKDQQVVENPTVIFEVLSKSTQRIDTREKLLAYQAVPALAVYVILHQDCVRAVVHRRANHWWPEILEGEETVLFLDEVGVRLPLGRLYHRVVWEAVED